MLLCLDVGGTELKGAAVQNGVLQTPILHFPAQSTAAKDLLLQHFADVFRAIAQQAPSEPITGLRLAFPGPFDYKNGVCLMQGLAKYDALYQVNLRHALGHALAEYAPTEQDIRFVNDVAAFALGELCFGQATGSQRSLFVCIGTGCGSAFGLGNRLAPPGTPGVPPDGYVYPYPFLDGCIDDALSRRGLMRLSQEQLGEALDGKGLATRVAQGDQNAAACFTAFGVRVRDALAPFLLDYRPDLLCLGGQITRSISLFGEPLQTFCDCHGIRLCVTSDTSVRAVQGLCVI